MRKKLFDAFLSATVFNKHSMIIIEIILINILIKLCMYRFAILRFAYFIL